MALQTPIVTVDSITIPQKSLFNITFKMVSIDDTEGFDGIDATYAIKYRPGDDIGDKTSEVIAAFQDEIDDYSSAKQLQTSQGMVNALVTIANGLVV